MRVVCRRVVYFGKSLVAYMIDGCTSMAVSRHIMHLCESPVSRHFGDSCRQLIAYLMPLRFCPVQKLLGTLSSRLPVLCKRWCYHSAVAHILGAQSVHLPVLRKCCFYLSFVAPTLGAPSSSLLVVCKRCFYFCYLLFAMARA